MTNIYILTGVGKVSDAHHEHGGLVIIAEDRQEAEWLISGESHVKVTEAEWERAEIYPLKRKAESEVIIFPDAGCC